MALEMMLCIICTAHEPRQNNILGPKCAASSANMRLFAGLASGAVAITRKRNPIAISFSSAPRLNSGTMPSGSQRVLKCLLPAAERSTVFNHKSCSSQGCGAHRPPKAIENYIFEIFQIVTVVNCKTNRGPRNVHLERGRSIGFLPI